MKKKVHIDCERPYGDAVTAKRQLAKAGYWPVHSQLEYNVEIWAEKSASTDARYAVGKVPGKDVWYVVPWLSSDEPPEDITFFEGQKNLFDFD